MAYNPRTNTLVGVLIGLGIALVVAGLAWLNDGRSQVVEKAVMFIFSTPALISFKLRSSDAFMMVLSFIYWALVGGVVGWLIGAGKRATKVTGFVVLVGLLASHWIAYLNLSAEIDAIGRALEALFGASR